MMRFWGSAGGGLACALVLLGAGVGNGQGEPRPRNDRAAPPAARSAAGLRKVSSILGATVRLKDGQTLGKVDDLLLTDDHTIAYAVVSVGDRHALVPWDAGTLNPGERALQVNVTRAQLEQVAFTGEDWPNPSDPEYGGKLRTVFGGGGERRPAAPERPAPREAPRPPEEKTVSATGPSEDAVEVLKLKVRDFIKAYDTDGDGKLSWKEVNAAFDAMGAKEDGLLDRNQLRAAALAVSEGKGGAEKPAGTRPAAGAAKAEADQDEGERGLDQGLIAFLREYDVNKDGKLSRDEVKAAFKAVDRDGDGFLDREELVRAGTRLLPPAKVTTTEERPAPERPAAGTAERRAPEPDDRVGFWLERFDKGRGGRISREEVRGTALESVFERIDVNRDGFLDREELRRAEKLLPAPEKKRPADRPQPRKDGPGPSPPEKPTSDRPSPERP
jgi:Ca2+-binding EF-hand superfamily protein